ncbi:MAG TPA: phosphoribosylanthranilate isomerase [Spirochaetota bacterium]|nr:phosphoribosylanthranilate isomerase [Spirochaetota bacterium]HPS87675.1 phosphoribosylanthranilate isomerase [Spirochaetota bacterium]
MFVKLCGFTRIEDIEFVKNFPVSSVGFIFYKNSRRYVSPHQACEMTSLLKGSGIKATGVFVDDKADSILKIVESANLDMVQVYNSNTANELSPFIPVISCIRVGGPEQRTLPEPHNGGMILFDTYSALSHGGTGKNFNHDLIREYPYREKMIIAGGVNEFNVKNIIRELRPGGIDISSGIEISEGIKSSEKILKIMQAIAEVKNDINA